MQKPAFAIIALTLLTGAALAGDTLAIPGVRGADDRKAMLKPTTFWAATGKVQVSGFSKVEFCTGVLVAPDVILTAAHCLTDPVTKTLVKPKRINFLAGQNGANNSGHARGKCIKLLGNVLAGGKATAASAFGTDAAVVKLDKRIKAAPVTLAEDASLDAGAAVTHAGYGRDRRYMLSVHANCQVTGGVDELALTDCDTTHGQSGGPLFVEDGGALKLAGIMVGFSEAKGSLALRIKAWRKLLEGSVCSGG